MGLDRQISDLPAGRAQRTCQERIGAERFEAGWRSGTSQRLSTRRTID